MASDRVRLTLDPELERGARAEAEAEGKSFSEWVTDVVAHRVRLRFLGEAIDAWEAEHGAITEEELARRTSGCVAPSVN